MTLRKLNQPPRKINGKNNSIYQTFQRRRRMYWINKYKVKRGCDICGYNKHGVALDWDHLVREEKEFTPSSSRMGLSLKRIFKEIRKCRLLCANCHRIETMEKQDYNNTHKSYNSLEDWPSLKEIVDLV